MTTMLNATNEVIEAIATAVHLSGRQDIGSLRTIVGDIMRDQAAKQMPAGDVVGEFLFDVDQPTTCPRCGSPHPHDHPAVQFEGEVEICTDDFHLTPTPQNRPEYINAVLAKRDVDPKVEPEQHVERLSGRLADDTIGGREG